MATAGVRVHKRELIKQLMRAGWGSTGTCVCSHMTGEALKSTMSLNTSHPSQIHSMTVHFYAE